MHSTFSHFNVWYTFTSKVEKQQVVSTMLMNGSYLSELCSYSILWVVIHLITQLRASPAKLIKIPKNLLLKLFLNISWKRNLGLPCSDISYHNELILLQPQVIFSWISVWWYSYLPDITQKANRGNTSHGGLFAQLLILPTTISLSSLPTPHPGPIQIILVIFQASTQTSLPQRCFPSRIHTPPVRPLCHMLHNIPHFSSSSAQVQL